MTATMTQVIAPFRADVAELLTATGVPTYQWAPDDPAHIPCQVIGRPSLRESGRPKIMLMTLDVTLLGRRASDDDSQAELDALADQMFMALGGTRLVRINGLAMRCEALLPGTVLVAGLEYPAYIASVSTDTVTC